MFAFLGLSDASEESPSPEGGQDTADDGPTSSGAPGRESLSPRRGGSLSQARGYSALRGASASVGRGGGGGSGGEGKRTPAEELVAEIQDGIEVLSDLELAAWVCRANAVLDPTMVQRARRTFRTRLRSTPPSAPFPAFGEPTPCPPEALVRRKDFEWFLKPAELRKAPRTHLEFWSSAPQAPWRDAVTKEPVQKKLTVKREVEAKERVEILDSFTAHTAAHAALLHGLGVSAQWLLALTMCLDLWEWPTWQVVAYVVKPVTEFRGRGRFAELPEVTQRRLRLPCTPL